MSREKYILTPEKEAYLKAKYDRTVRGRSYEIADVFGWPKWAICRHARELGLSRIKERRWSEQDISYIEKHISTMSEKQIARHLKRSRIAVHLKAKRLGYTKRGEGYTATSLAKAFGVDNHWVLSRINNGCINASRRHTERTALQGGDEYYITEKAVIDFIKHYPLEIDLRKVDQLWFIELVMGIHNGV